MRGRMCSLPRAINLVPSYTYLSMFTRGELAVIMLALSTRHDYGIHCGIPLVNMELLKYKYDYTYAHKHADTYTYTYCDFIASI
jgi:hypothetical protein